MSQATRKRWLMQKVRTHTRHAKQGAHPLLPRLQGATQKDAVPQMQSEFRSSRLKSAFLYHFLFPIIPVLFPTPRPGGVIGSRASLRNWSRKRWRFKSSPGHKSVKENLPCGRFSAFVNHSDVSKSFLSDFLKPRGGVENTLQIRSLLRICLVIRDQEFCAQRKCSSALSR